MLDDVYFRGSVEITVFRGDKILAVTSRRYGGFCGVGGKVEPGETLEQAARRELLEETGCVAESIAAIAGAPLDPLEQDGPNSPRWYCHGFVVDIGEQEPEQVEEGTRPFWTTKEELIERSIFPGWYRWWFGILRYVHNPISEPPASAHARAVKVPLLLAGQGRPSLPAASVRPMSWWVLAWVVGLIVALACVQWALGAAL